MNPALNPHLNPLAGLQRIVLVTGLSGAGKGSILRIFEDLGFETVDNPPLDLLENMVAGSDRHFAVGVDARTRGFDQDSVLATLTRLRGVPGIRPELIYAWANETALLRRYTESRRRHPLAKSGRVSDGILAEEHATARLRAAADMAIDTSDLPLPALRRMIEHQFTADPGADAKTALTITLLSFAFPVGLPPDADMVFDARFLRNPHYDPALRPLTGLDHAVGTYIEVDPDYANFEKSLAGLLDLLLPRFVHEGKKYATIAIGCTGGRHRSVHTAEKLATHLRNAGWRAATSHRELVLARSPVPSGTTPPDTVPPDRQHTNDTSERPSAWLASPQEA